jgi:hypothetical protein
MTRPIFSQSQDDVDNRYIDLDIRPILDGKTFALTLMDSSNDGEYDSEIELCLTREELQLVIDRLTKELKNEI